MNELNKLKNGEYYHMFDSKIGLTQTKAIALCQKFNTIQVTKEAKRLEIINELFGSVGKKPKVKPGFFCDMGINIHVGDNFLTNFNVTILDMATVTIGNNVWLGPNVGLYTVAHPMEATGREKSLGIAKPIIIGDNVWIGGNSVVVMGVTIGNNAVIGAGSVVTKDVPENALVAGNPARIIRYISND